MKEVLTLAQDFVYLAPAKTAGAVSIEYRFGERLETYRARVATCLFATGGVEDKRFGIANQHDQHKNERQGQLVYAHHSAPVPPPVWHVNRLALRRCGGRTQKTCQNDRSKAICGFKI